MVELASEPQYLCVLLYFLFPSFTPNANKILMNIVIYFENAMFFVCFDTLVTYIS